MNDITKECSCPFDFYILVHLMNTVFEGIEIILILSSHTVFNLYLFGKVKQYSERF